MGCGNKGVRTFCLRRIVVDLVGQEGRPLVFLMPFLSARFSLAFPFSATFAVGLLDDIARRRLRRIGRVFSGGGQFVFELIESLRQLFDHRRLFGDQSFQSFDLSVLGVHADNCHDWPPWRNTTYGEGVPLAADS